jgi:hypothetical protein
MRFLSRLPFRNELNDYALSDHERELFLYPRGDSIRVYNQSARNIIKSDQNRICEEKSFDLASSGSTIIQASFHRAHRVALIRHRGRAIWSFARLLEFFPCSEMPDVPANILRRGGEAGNCVGYD